MSYNNPSEGHKLKRVIQILQVLPEVSKPSDFMLFWHNSVKYFMY